MPSNALKFMTRGAWSVGLSLFAASTIFAQNRVVLPEGSVILVTTEVPLESSTARAGQTFETAVSDTVGVDNYTVIPEGSHIRGVIGFVQPATRQQSGVIQVTFDRLTLPDGTSYPIQARLTSTDANERRQIDQDPNARVVLVGGRGGIGAAIAGAGSDKSPASGILSALGSLLSQAQDVRVPAGTPLAVQLDQRLTLRGRGTMRGSDEFTIYTDAARIRAAQRALAQQNYYHGPVNGLLDEETQRALFDFQVAKGMVGTGNLNGRTAQALGIVGSANPMVTRSAVLSADQASLLRRGAQALVSRDRQELAVTSVGQLSTRRTYADADIDLWFALSAFADNALLYEQLVRSSGNDEASVMAGRALINAARRVDSVIQNARSSTQVQNAWATLRQQLAGIDPSYA